jgi:hypothetical protein
MMQTINKIQWADGITIVRRKDDATGAEDIGLEMTKQGFRHLKKLAHQKSITAGAFSRQILADALRPRPAPVCIDDLTQEQLDQRVREAIARDGEFVVDITPLCDDLEAAEALARRKGTDFS